MPSSKQAKRHEKCTCTMNMIHHRTQMKWKWTNQAQEKAYSMSQLFNRYVKNKLHEDGYRDNTNHSVEEFFKYNTSQLYQS